MEIALVGMGIMSILISVVSDKSAEITELRNRVSVLETNLENLVNAQNSFNDHQVNFNQAQRTHNQGIHKGLELLQNLCRTIEEDLNKLTYKVKKLDKEEK